MSTYDLYITGKTEENVEGFATFTTGFNRSIGVRGPYKLITQWVKRFLTTKGTDPTDPEGGTEFPLLIGSNIVSEADVRDVVLLAIEDCNAQISEIQQDTQPDLDEQLLSAVLTKFEVVSADEVEAWVTIRNAKGEALTVRLPDFATRT